MQDRRALPRGLYAITDRALIPTGSLVERVGAAIRGGAVMIQYREKRLGPDARRREAQALVELCRRRRVPLIINDDAGLAAAVGAAGVHLGAEDAGVKQARSVLGPAAIIGVSCYNRLERAHQAVAAGADYVAFGRFFPSASKPGALPAAPSLLAQARREIALPIVAIGGITPENGAELVKAGADLLAVIHGVFGQTDVEAAAQRYRALFADR